MKKQTNRTKKKPDLNIDGTISWLLKQIDAECRVYASENWKWASRVMVGAARWGINAERIAELLYLPRPFVDEVIGRMRIAGLWDGNNVEWRHWVIRPLDFERFGSNRGSQPANVSFGGSMVMPSMFRLQQAITRKIV